MMEWVETTGRTIEEAKEAALDELGVDAQDAEFEVLEEPKLGLFGRLRTEGRVRARVRPSTPRAKEDRRDRRRRNRTGQTAAEEATAAPAPVANQPQSGPDPETTTDPTQSGSPSPRPRVQTPPRSSPVPRSRETPTEPTQSRNTNEGDSLMDVAMDRQAELASSFLQDLLDRFGVSARLTVVTSEEEDRVEIHVLGDNLGILIGPKGSTLLAIQDLTRTFVQNRTGARNGRIHIDISRYREKRATALAAFTEKIARDVLTTGRAIALEPMSPPDRKVVHDTVAGIAGVDSRSEGEDDHRHVVVSRGAETAAQPDSDA